VLTEKGWATAILALLIVSLAVGLQKWSLLLFSLPLIYSLILSRQAPATGTVRVDLSRELSRTRLIEGEELEVNLRVKNLSNSPLILGLEDKIAEPLTVVEGANKGILVLRPREEKSVKYRVSSIKRGHYEIGPAIVEIYDPFLMRRVERFGFEQDKIMYLPKLLRKYRVGLAATYTIPRTGEIASKRPGEGGDFLEVKEAQGGVLRRINWKATAKLQKWMVNVFESERLTNVIVVLDVSGKRILGREVEVFVDALVRVAASLVFGLTLSGYRVAMLVVGNYRDWVKPGSGKRHLIRLLSALADVRYLPTRQIVDYGEVFKRISYILSPSGSSVVIISSFTEEEVYRIISEAEGMGYSITCIAVNPFEIPSLRSLRSKNILSEIWREGILEILPRKSRRAVMVEPYE